MLKHPFTFLLMALCLCFMIACENKVNKSDVMLQDAPKIISDIATTSYAINPNTSVVKWMSSFRFMPGEHHGNIKIIEGNLILDGDYMVGGNVLLNMKSISDNDLSETDENAKLINHLKNTSFFHTDSFPTALLQITSVVYSFDETKKAQKAKINAELTIKGIKNAIIIPADIENINNEISVVAHFYIDRKIWNLSDEDKQVVADPNIEKNANKDLEFEWLIKADRQ